MSKKHNSWLTAGAGAVRKIYILQRHIVNDRKIVIMQPLLLSLSSTRRSATQRGRDSVKKELQTGERNKRLMGHVYMKKEIPNQKCGGCKLSVT